MHRLRMRCLLAIFLVAGVAHAAPIDDRRDELKGLRAQIGALQAEISQSEDVREDAADLLSEVERNISGAQRRLREIQLMRGRLDAEIVRLVEEQARLQAEVDAQRQRLGDTLYRIYVEGGQAGARRFLGGDDPNQLARDAYYLEQIARQRARAIDEARVSLSNLQTVLAEVEAKRAQLLALETERKGQQKELSAQRAQQRAVLNAAAEKLRAQRREMKSLQRDEARMEKLIQGLDRIARSNPPPAKPRNPAVNRPAQAGASQPAAGERVTGIASDVARPEDGGDGAFAAQRGKLRWPVRGELLGRFGAQRAEGGSWRGVMIRAAGGSEVRSVAGGRVAFADWLRGFGNLIIVDHGEGYMSIYGNNESLFKSPGQPVRQGESIASVGATGGAEESGLYFEIRYRGQPQDPVKWMTGR
ncbi:MAG: peptidoglycan DD-metalloendopeptidase family protein [Moraxellaceae bacterium]|nr:peptidoglycan DD-metalloendopeptidase family protein [Moraxellaceae bacterium]